MNNIAEELHTSKRTLYTYFPDKRSLVLECVQTVVENRKIILVEMESEAKTSLQAILNINHFILKQIPQWCPAFSRDLNSFSEAKEAYRHYHSIFRVKLSSLLQQAISEGALIPELDTNMVLDFFTTQIHAVSKKYWTGQIDTIFFYNQSILIFLTGICTSEGRKELDKYKSSISQNE